MLVSLFAFTAAIFASTEDVNNNSATKPVAKPKKQISAPLIDPVVFEGRKEESIAFSNDVRGFRIEREGNKDALYLDTGFGEWYRVSLNCHGFGSPDSALQMATISRGSREIDRTTRFNFYDFGDRRPSSECWANSMVKLTIPETVTLELETQKSVDARAKIVAEREAKRALKIRNN